MPEKKSAITKERIDPKTGKKIVTIRKKKKPEAPKAKPAPKAEPKKEINVDFPHFEYGGYKKDFHTVFRGGKKSGDGAEVTYKKKADMVKILKKDIDRLEDSNPKIMPRDDIQKLGALRLQLKYVEQKYNPPSTSEIFMMREDKDNGDLNIISKKEFEKRRQEFKKLKGVSLERYPNGTRVGSPGGATLVFIDGNKVYGDEDDYIDNEKSGVFGMRSRGRGKKKIEAIRIGNDVWQKDYSYGYDYGLLD